jgi:molybdenum cofactor biosynthesis protein A
MPEDGIRYMAKKELLTFEEIIRLVTLMASMGISKLRLTGGEPFVRNDFMQLIRRLREVPGIKDIHLTTNGLLTAPHIPELKKLGVASVNLSLDTMDKERFRLITRRDEFDNTMRTLHLLLEHGIPLKVNTVVMAEKNTEDLVPMARFTEENDVALRFIEEMPFNGKGRHEQKLLWNHRRIYEHLSAHFPSLHKIDDPANSTASHYKIKGSKGTIGIIAAFSRTFCGTCNRIRLTAQGTLKTCLYDDGVLDIKHWLRAGITDGELKDKLLQAFNNRAKNGFEAEANRKDHQRVHESMSTIGG